MYRKQFLLTREKGDFSNLEQKQIIGDYFLYLGIDSEYEFIKKEGEEYHLLGSMFDWENPQLTNKQILQKVSEYSVIEDVINSTNKYTGEFIVIVKLYDNIYIFNDAASQKEVYYDEDFRCFGTQPKLLGLSIKLEEHTDIDAIAYYQSKIFKSKCLFTGNTTHKRNVFHLLPNRFLHINEKKVIRFFPLQKIIEQPKDIVVKKSIEMLKGYILAISLRNKLRISVTGGYDSRVLFLASLNVECEYFVYKFRNMKESHHDIVIPKQLAEIYNKRFKVEEDELYTTSSEKDVNYINDIDFPRFLRKTVNQENHILINGNISEIARNHYGYHYKSTEKDLCYLIGYSNLTFARKQYTLWLKDDALFKKNGYHHLDMFYWEERMANWAAKSKTEAHALGLNVISPFNSRGLINLLLSANRKYRDFYNNQLYVDIISELSEKNSKITKLPFNPTLKQNIIRFMKTLRIYNIYRYIGVKLRILYE